MPTVTVKAIHRQHILNNDDYLWILDHRNEPLRLCSISYLYSGKLSTIAVHRSPGDIIVLFPDNMLEVEVNYNDAGESDL